MPAAEGPKRDDTSEYTGASADFLADQNTVDPHTPSTLCSRVPQDSDLDDYYVDPGSPHPIEFPADTEFNIDWQAFFAED
ncbi:hypothetical protein LTR70_009242 [Exophiala xenobiotica]|uniref:Uncharacterized protein n=1 Tax=Lithohypha guttulata TaxID=1690604 RepID=A0ABR0K1S9_9EURO|nr:hypothetical protein LTR24_008050 [Lithohypha guttulata]KAK5310747.1 hypothetical protein LTR70_009242 [Exophiala xenobiotica]